MEGRPAPYFKVVREFFQEKLQNFVPPQHTCTCNVCCLDLDTLKRQAVEKAVAEEQARHAASTSAHLGQTGGDMADDERVAGAATANEGGARSNAGSNNAAVNQQEHQELLDEIEELREGQKTRDACLKALQAKFEKFLGSGKALLTEEVLYGSQSMKTLITQASALLTEVEKRENVEVQLGDAQGKLQAAFKEKKLMQQSFRAGMDEVSAEVESLRS